MSNHDDVHIPAPGDWPPRRAPAPAEACSDIGFEHEAAPRRARMGALHRFERAVLHHPNRAAVTVLLAIGLAYLLAVN